MNFLELIYFSIGTATILFVAIFIYDSFHEKKSRAVVVGIFFLLFFFALWLGIYILFSPTPMMLLVPLGLVFTFLAFFFLPLGRTESINIGQITKRIDERDTMFAREGYEPGGDKYNQYYSNRPRLKEIDDKIRRLPKLLKPGGKYYDPSRSEHISSIFDEVRKYTTQVDGEVNGERKEIDPLAATALIKHTTLELGADEVGIARLNPAFVYSHVGRGPEEWGSPIQNYHRFAIAFTVEMDYHSVEAAPQMATVEETARQYLRAAKISTKLAEIIRSMGYPARAHISEGNYQIMLPPVAHDAGLGELGRFGYLISAKYGARIRLGGITTDLPLIPDHPIKFGVQDFCKKCLRCADHCPSGSIPKGGKTDVNGVEKWAINVESCLFYWRVIGTDCGICMKVCPFSHPDTMIHNIARSGIKRSPLARSISVFAEKLFYGA